MSLSPPMYPVSKEISYKKGPHFNIPFLVINEGFLIALQFKVLLQICVVFVR
jgi:hypothetical protein